MLGLMAEGIHSCYAAYAAAYHGDQEKIGLRYAESASFGPSLVNSPLGKTHYIHYYNIKKQN